MGRPPTHGAPSFRFFHSEVAQMEALLQEHGGHVPSRDLLMALANKFSNSQERSGKIAVQMKQVWNWFQNRRYALRAKLVKSPGNPNVPPNPRDEAPQVRNVPPVPQQTPVPSGHNVSRNTSENPPMEFEAKSARDGAWYDVQVFLSHRYLETGNPEVLVRFSGFGPEEDEWVNIRKHVRQRSLPCESSECVAVLPGDLILCFQEGKEQALYFDAHVLDAQRRRHDVRGCRCRFLVRYDHDQTEEIVPLRKVCRRPETDYRLQQLHAANESASASASASASTSTSVSAESKKPAVDPNLNSTMRVTNPNPTAAVTVPPPTITNVTASSLISTPTSAPISASTLNSAPTPTPISAPTPTPTLTSPNPTPILAPTLTPISTPTPTPISAPIPPLTSASTLISAPSPSLNSAPTPSPTLISAPSPSSISAPTPSSTLISAPSPSSTPISAPTPSSTLNTAPSPSSTPISAPSPSSTPIAAPPSPTPVSASSPTPISDPSPSSAPIIAPPTSILVSAPSPTPISAASPTLVSAPPSTVVLASAPSLCPAVAPAPTPTPAPVDPSPSSSPIIAPSPSPILVSASSPTPIPAASPTLISAPTSSPPSTLALASAPSLSPVIAPAPTPPPVPVSSSIPVAAPESKKLERNGSGISAVEASVQDNIIDSGAADKIVESKKEEICVNPETSVVTESRVSQEDLSDNPTVVPVPEPEKVSEPRMVVGASTTDGALIAEENSDLTVSNAKE